MPTYKNHPDGAANLAMFRFLPDVVAIAPNGIKRETGHTHKHTTRTTPNTRHDKNSTTNDHTKKEPPPRERKEFTDPG